MMNKDHDSHDVTMPTNDHYCDDSSFEKIHKTSILLDTIPHVIIVYDVLCFRFSGWMFNKHCNMTTYSRYEL